MKVAEKNPTEKDTPGQGVYMVFVQINSVSCRAGRYTCEGLEECMMTVYRMNHRGTLQLTVYKLNAHKRNVMIKKKPHAGIKLQFASYKRIIDRRSKLLLCVLVFKCTQRILCKGQ